MLYLEFNSISGGCLRDKVNFLVHAHACVNKLQLCEFSALFLYFYCLKWPYSKKGQIRRQKNQSRLKNVMM